MTTEASLCDEDVLLRSSDDVTILSQVKMTLVGAPGPGNRHDNVVEMGTS